MTLNLKKMFDQFIPLNLFMFPMSLVGGILSLLWMCSLSKSHWTNNRKSFMNLFIKFMQVNLFGNKNLKAPWSALLLPLFMLWLSLNLLSLIPYSFSLSSHLSMTLSISIPLWLSFKMMGISQNWKSKASHLLPMGTPIFLIPLMIVIETLSLLIQPITLGFRLGANLMAGHLLIFLCSCVVTEAISLHKCGILSFILLFLLLTLEMAVACMQSAVFMMLSKQYLEENLN